MDKEALRTKALKDSDQFTYKSRFGLFSHQVSTAVGDNGPFQHSQHPREDDGKGKPLLQPKNIQSGSFHLGKSKDSYFGGLNPLVGSEIKDQYIEEPKRLLKEENQKYYKTKNKQNQFVPLSGTGNKTLAKAAYQYIEDKKPLPNPKRNRDGDGRVKLQNTNIIANTPKNIANKYFKKPQFISDPFDRAHKKELQKKKRDKELQPQAAFKPNNFVPKTFTKDSLAYGCDRQIAPKKQKKTKNSHYVHDSDWKPSHSGKKGCFTSFPTYHENPPTQLKRKDLESKQAFKSMSTMKTRPSPSITLNPANMKRYLK